jgi:hypothetical protein
MPLALAQGSRPARSCAWRRTIHGPREVGAQRNQEPVSALLAKREKKDNKYVVATKVSFVAPIGPFFDRLDTFSIARLLKITLVLLFSGEIHYLPSLRASLGRELTQRRFSSAQIRPFLMQKAIRDSGAG